MNMNKGIKRAIITLVILIFFAWILFGSYFAHKYDTWDSAAVSRLGDIQKRMESYHDIHQRYPDIGASCGDLFALMPYLNEDQMFGFLKKYSEPRTFVETIFHRPVYTPTASVSADGQSYVLRLAGLERRKVVGNRNGVVLGCDCNIPNFCMGNEAGRPEDLNNK